MMTALAALLVWVWGLELKVRDLGIWVLKRGGSILKVLILFASTMVCRGFPTVAAHGSQAKVQLQSLAQYGSKPSENFAKSAEVRARLFQRQDMHVVCCVVLREGWTFLPYALKLKPSIAWLPTQQHVEQGFVCSSDPNADASLQMRPLQPPNQGMTLSSLGFEHFIRKTSHLTWFNYAKHHSSDDPSHPAVSWRLDSLVLRPAKGSGSHDVRCTISWCYTFLVTKTH